MRPMYSCLSIKQSNAVLRLIGSFSAGVMALFAFTSEIVADQQLGLTYVNASDTFLENPHDLKLSPNGKWLFVSDVGNNRIAVLDPKTLKLLSSFGSDHQSGTHDIDFDASGKAYVADTHNNRILIYQMEGPTGKQIGELNKRIRGPEGVLCHPNGWVYVAGAWSGNVVAFDGEKIVAELTGLSSPHDLEVNADGDIWLADSGNHRMLLLSPDLKVKKELSGPPYDFNGVRYQDFLADGTLVLADKNNHQVKLISSDSRLLGALGTGQPGKGPNQFTTPEGVEVGESTIWISDSGNDRIVQYKLHLP